MNGLPEILVQAFNEKKVFTPSGTKVPMHSNVSEEECHRLFETVKSLRPDTSVEIGFAQGISALAILQALHANGRGLHYVIDPFQARFENCGLAMVEKAGLGDRFAFYEKYPEEIIPTLPRVQFAFIDSSHLFDLTLSEFVLVDKRLDVGGVIGFHDLWMPSLQRLVRYILENRAYEIHRHAPLEGASLPAKIVSRLAGCFPHGARIFSQDLLKPWSALGLPNLVLLRKTGEDTREWDFHKAF